MGLFLFEILMDSSEKEIRRRKDLLYHLNQELLY